MRMLPTLTLLAVSALTLSGCGTLNTAKHNSFACQGSECPTPLEVYSETNGYPADLAMGHTPSRWSVTQAGKRGKGSSRKEEKAMREALDADALDLVRGVSPYADAVVAETGGLAQPIRTPAQVMRVWVAPWIDSQDNLHMNGFVYTEVAQRRWAFGEPEIRASDPLSLTMPVR